MEILRSFGFNPMLFIAQIVNFLILAYLFKRFLYKPILTVLQERQKKIAQGLSDAQKAAEDRLRAETERDMILKNASEEARKILDETKETAQQMREEILTQGRDEAEKIIHNAKEQAELEFEKMQTQAQKLSLALSEKILEQVTGDIFTKEEKDKIVKRSMQKIKSL